VQNAVVVCAHRQQTRYPIVRRRPFRVVHKGESAPHPGTKPVQPKNFNHRDQRAVCCAPRAARRPVSLSTTPVPLRKPRARHERASAKCRISGGLPSAARQRRCAPTPFPPSLRLRSTVSARRPQTKA
jgi:hypothetical protein